MKTQILGWMIIGLAGAFTLSAQPSDTVKLKPSFYEVNDYVDDNEACLQMPRGA